MVKVKETLNIDSSEVLNIQDLILILEESYRDLAVAVNKKPDIYEREVAGVPSNGVTADNFLSTGDININSTTNKVEILTNRSADGSTVVWTTI